MAEREPKVCLTFDFDGISAWAGSLGMTSPSAVSRGEFAGRVAVPRVLDILAREGVRATFFVPGITVEAWPDVCRRILDEGHEIGCVPVSSGWMEIRSFDDYRTASQLAP